MRKPAFYAVPVFPAGSLSGVKRFPNDVDGMMSSPIGRKVVVCPIGLVYIKFNAAPFFAGPNLKQRLL